MTRALARAKLSAREADRRACISEGRWRQMASDYQVVSAGVYAPAHRPAGTPALLATIACPLGLCLQAQRAPGRRRRQGPL